MTKIERHFCKFAESRNDEAKKAIPTPPPSLRGSEAIHLESINQRNAKFFTKPLELQKDSSNYIEFSEIFGLPQHFVKMLRNDASPLYEAL